MSTTVEYILDVETQRAQKGLKRTDQQAQRTGRSFRNLRSQARGLSGSFQSVGEVSSLINPQMGALADTTMALAGAFRGLGRALASGNPIIIGITALVITAIAAYSAFTASAKANKESQDKLRNSLKAVNEAIEETRQVARQAADALAENAGQVNELVLQYDLMTGAISKAEVEQLKLDKTIGDMESKLTEQQAQREAALKAELVLEGSRRRALNERIYFLIAEDQYMVGINQLSKEAAALEEQRSATNLRISQIQSEIRGLEKEGVERIAEQVDEYRKAAEAIRELKKEEQARKEAERRRNEARQAAQKRANDLAAIFMTLQGENQRLSDMITKSEISRLDPVSRVNAQYDQEIIALQRIEQATLQNLQKAESIARSKKDQVALAEIQAQKEEILANTKQAAADAEIKRQAKLSDVYRKQSAIRAKGIDQTAKRLEAQNKQQVSLLSELQSIIKEANADQLDDLDKINQLEEERLTKLILIGKQLGVNTEEAERAVRARAQRERTALDGGGGAVSGAAGAIQAIVDPRSLVDALGEVSGEEGKAIATIINTLSGLGEKTPEQLQQEFETFFLGIAKGIEMLAPLLIEILPPILFDAVGHIIDALIQLPSQIIAGFFKVTNNLLGGIIKFFRGDFFKAIGDFFTNLFEGFVDLITAPFESLFGGSKMGGGKMLSGQGGLRFTGSKRGLAMLHEGETVVPASGQVSSTVQANMERFSGGGGRVIININSAVTEQSAIDDLVRKIERRFGSFGGSTSTLFGGV